MKEKWINHINKYKENFRKRFKVDFESEIQRNVTK